MRARLWTAATRRSKLADFGPDESPRSLQLYGTDPYYVAEAVKRLVGEGRIDHLDMNFGCPVPKVTRKGGGAAIPLKPKLLAGTSFVRQSRNAGSIPVTIKFRIGVNDNLLTFLTAGRLAEEEGCAAVGLACAHGRAALSRPRRLGCDREPQAIGEDSGARQRRHLGSGRRASHDASDRLRRRDCRARMPRTSLAVSAISPMSLTAGRPSNPPDFGEVLEIMFRHARMMADWFGERLGLVSFRRHASWYTKGFRMTSELRAGMMRVESMEDLNGSLKAQNANNRSRRRPCASSAARVRECRRRSPCRSAISTISTTPLRSDGADEDMGDGG